MRCSARRSEEVSLAGEDERARKRYSQLEDGTLMIEDTQGGDEGVYECVAKNAAGETKANAVELSHTGARGEGRWARGARRGRGARGGVGVGAKRGEGVRGDMGRDMRAAGTRSGKGEKRRAWLRGQGRGRKGSGVTVD